MAEPKEKSWTKDDFWKSDKYDEEGVHGNRIKCWEEGPVAICHWELLNRDKTWDLGFVMTSEKLKDGKFTDTLCFAKPVGQNLIKGSDIEKELKETKPDGSKCMRV
jgi:hypothetical protein